MEWLIPIAGIAGVFGTTGFIVYIAVVAMQRRQQLRVAAEFHSKLLDRMSSASELGALLNSPGGARFLESLTIRAESSPHARVLRATSSGIVLTALGIGLAMYSRSAAPWDREFGEGVGFLSTVSLSLGLGLIAAAWTTHRLARSMGLLEPPTQPASPPPSF